MITGQGMVKYEEVLRYIIRTNNLHRMGDYASKIYEVVPGLEERWPKFFKNKINQILKEEGVDKDLEDFRK
ncbi:MAG: hypothetical protein J7497_17450, partial [Chitinophagaceae bacterium]|nr:hypothetical protein [Chitinophagaceae bacterium]